MDSRRTMGLVQLVSELGVVEGRKRLQKIVHLLKEKGHAEFDHRFILHYFGPFSRELAALLDFLRRAEVVEEEDCGGSYNYRLGDAKQPRALQAQLRKGSRRWLSSARALNELSTPRLEAASTLVFLHRSGFRGTKLKARFNEVKPGLKRLYPEALKFAKSNHYLVSK